jgi:hypothetical protein
MMSSTMSFTRFSYCFAECHYTECHYAESCYAECHYDECHYTKCHYAECPDTAKLCEYRGKDIRLVQHIESNFFSSVLTKFDNVRILRITTFGITTISITTFGITTLSITTFSKTTLHSA